MKRLFYPLWTILLALLLAFIPMAVSANSSYLGNFNTLSVVASTVPANGDINPYGIDVVTHSIGDLVKGDILVSNFNGQANLQGTGSTIVEIAPNGNVSLFAEISSANRLGHAPAGWA